MLNAQRSHAPNIHFKDNKLNHFTYQSHSRLHGSQTQYDTPKTFDRPEKFKENQQMNEGLLNYVYCIVIINNNNFENSVP